MTAAATRPASSASRDTAIVLSTTVLSLVGSLGTQSCLAWFLEPAGRGAFAVCVTFASVAAVVFGLAADRAAQYHLIARDFSAGQATTIAYVATLASAALAAAFGWLLIGSPHPFFAKADPGAFRLSLLLIPLLGLSTALTLLLGGMGRFAAMGGLNLLSTVANLALTIVGVGLLGLGVEGALWALVLAQALTVLLQTRAIWRFGGGFAWPRLADFGRVASYGLRYYVARLGNVVNLQIGLIVMAWVAPQEEIGLFAAASVLISRVMVIPDSISTALQPRVGPAVDGQPDLVAAAARVSLASVAGALAVLLAASAWIVPILLSQAFAGAVILLWLMAPGLWLKAATKPITSYFIGLNRPGVVSLSTGVELVGNVVALPLLYRRFGLAGAAAATSVACALASLVLVVAFRTVSGMALGQTWVPRLSDFSRLLDRRRWLGGGTPPASPLAPTGDDPARFRRIELLPDRVVKYRRPKLIAVEVEKTTRGAAIGAATGLFRVPSVLEADVSNGWMAIERIDGLTPLHERLQRGRAGEPLLAQVGAALAAIHDGLELPSDMRRPLPARWAAPEARVDVALHGDFNTRNLFVQRDTGALVVTDWETSFVTDERLDPAPREIPTIGPRYFDLAWFIASVFGRTWYGLGRVAEAQACAEAFLRGYFREAGPAARPEGFPRYLARFADPLEVAEAARSGPWLDRVCHPRSRIRVSCGALRDLAGALAAERPERLRGPALDA